MESHFSWTLATGRLSMTHWITLQPWSALTHLNRLFYKRELGAGRGGRKEEWRREMGGHIQSRFIICIYEFFKYQISFQRNA